MITQHEPGVGRSSARTPRARTPAITPRTSARFIPHTSGRHSSASASNGQLASRTSPFVRAGSKPHSSSTVTASLRDRKSTRLNSSHGYISYAVFCLKKKKQTERRTSLKPPEHEASVPQLCREGERCKASVADGSDAGANHLYTTRDQHAYRWTSHAL